MEAEAKNRLLVVDDDRKLAGLIRDYLTPMGYEVELRHNGPDGLAEALAMPYQAVILDVMMPGMDGLEATRRIRQDKRFARLPIIAITAKAMKDDQEQCLAAGANDYLAKPIDLTRLYSLLRVWMPTLERI